MVFFRENDSIKVYINTKYIEKHARNEVLLYGADITFNSSIL
jgi:hypothetical protein